MSTTANQDFQATAARGLRQYGIRGKATLRLDGDALVITGTKAGHFRIVGDDVAKIRSNFERATRYGPYYETRLWLSGGHKSLLVVAGRPNRDAARALWTDFATVLHRRDGTARLECGSSIFWVLLLVVPMALLLAATAALGLFALQDEHWWQRCVPSLVPAMLLVMLVFMAWRGRPRQAATLQDYVRQLG